MNCNNIRFLIQQKFDFELDANDEDNIIEHIANCEACAKFEQQLSQVLDAVAQADYPDNATPTNLESLARTVMEQMPKNKGGIFAFFGNIFSGFGSKQSSAPTGFPHVKRSVEGSISSSHIPKSELDDPRASSARLKSMRKHSDEVPVEASGGSLSAKFGMSHGTDDLQNDEPANLAETIRRKISLDKAQSEEHSEAQGLGANTQSSDTNAAAPPMPPQPSFMPPPPPQTAWNNVPAQPNWNAVSPPPPPPPQVPSAQPVTPPPTPAVNEPQEGVASSNVPPQSPPAPGDAPDWNAVAPTQQRNWSQEAEQIHTGVWQAFGNDSPAESLGAPQAASHPFSSATPIQPPPPPLGQSAAAQAQEGVHPFDIPIQERMKMQQAAQSGEQSAAVQSTSIRDRIANIIGDTQQGQQGSPEVTPPVSPPGSDQYEMSIQERMRLQAQNSGQAQAPTASVQPGQLPQGEPSLLNLDDSAMDDIFGTNLGVSAEQMSGGMVNPGASQTGAAQEQSNLAMSPPPPPPPPPSPLSETQSPPPVTQTSASAQNESGLLQQMDDSDMDKLFGDNLGVLETSTSAVGANNAESTPQLGAPIAPPPPPTQEVTPPPPPQIGGVQQFTPFTPPAQNDNKFEFSSPQQVTPPDLQMVPPPTPVPPPIEPPAFQQPVAPPIPATPVQAPQDDKLFALNDNDIDQLFADNLGLQANENQPTDDASKVNVNQAVQAIRTLAEHDEAVPPPPKIEGLGRLDVKPGEEVGPGRISQIGKFLLDPKDLAQIGRLTEADLTDTKMRILTMEEAQNLQAVLQQIHAIPGVIGSIIVGHDGILIANSMPAELDSEAMGVWSLGIFLNTQNSVKKLGHNHVHQVVSRTPSGYLIIADFGGGILVTLSEGSETERLIPLMRNITKLVAA